MHLVPRAAAAEPVGIDQPCGRQPRPQQQPQPLWPHSARASCILDGAEEEEASDAVRRRRGATASEASGASDLALLGYLLADGLQCLEKGGRSTSTRSDAGEG